MKMGFTMCRIAGCLAAFLASMTLSAAPTRIDVTARPEGAKVIVDGVSKGIVPVSVFDVGEGSHLLRIEAPGHRFVEEVLSVKDGDFLRTDYELEPEKGLLLEVYKYCAEVSVRYRNTNALSGKVRLICLNDFIAFDFAPKFKRFLFALFFLTADIRNNIINHFRPCFKSFACARNCLICANQNILNSKLLMKREESGNIRLKRAV